MDPSKPATAPRPSDGSDQQPDANEAPSRGTRAKTAAVKATTKAGTNSARPAEMKASTNEKQVTAPPQALYYVGIGASAGGLEALRPFVSGLPLHANMTYIIAQHMSPNHRSMMVELLARETGLTVVEAKHNVQPKADTVYIAPPNSDITVTKGKLRISKPTKIVGPKPSVDRFFLSLAEDLEDRAIGIILSGTGSDGAHGIRAIKAAGGICIAQDPASAKYDSMANAAIRAGGTDLVLPPHEIAEQLRFIVEAPRAPIIEDSDTAPPSGLRGIVRQIAVHTGMDFSNYKESTLSRQIMRRMAAMQIPDLEAYGKYISNHGTELSELAGNFLICVTSFFRDPESFESLRRALREILKEKAPGDEIRVWVPGCATGEEVYTIAILIVEELGKARDQYKIQLFATDINGDAVSIARAGLYPEASLSEVDNTLIERYFTPHDGRYLIDKSLREMTLFARQDIVQDPPFARLDLVSCRNMLIYFKPDLQDRVMKIFHYSLRRDGILFLGKSESIGRQSGLFIEKDRKHKIFLKRAVSTPTIGGFSRSQMLSGNDLARAADKPPPPSNVVVGHDKLFEIYAPPSILMTVQGDILEIFGDCGRFLSIKTGKADFNAYNMIPANFRAELRAYAHRVSRTRNSVVSRPQEVDAAGLKSYYRMAVHDAGNVDQGGHDAKLLLVSFEPVTEKTSPTTGEAHANALSNERLQELEHELVLNRENLQTVIEELETANEELQSLNEEAQAANEELQASNEELETSNEELQSTNEELTTVNDELGSRTLELAEANRDLHNILNSLYKALLVVDGELRITRHNKQALDFFDIPTGAKPNLAMVNAVVDIPDLLSLIRQVLKGHKYREMEFQREDGRSFQVRLTPYLDPDHAFGSQVIIAIIDVTEKKLAEEKLRLSASVFENATQATMITDASNTIISVNKAFTRITGYTPEEAIGRTPNLLNSGQQSKEFFKRMWEVLMTTGTWQGEITNRRKDGNMYTEWLSINVLRDENDTVSRFIAVFSESTDAKRAQETIEYQATYDALTGLPNRYLTMDRLKQLVASSRRKGGQFAVMYLDLDNFKAVNDTLGHPVGDDLLVNTALRLKAVLRESDSVGRMGGDEFVVLLGEINDERDIIAIADKILDELSQPLVIGGNTLQTSSSIGITLFPNDGHTPDEMLQNADSALYEAKQSGRNRFCFFTQRMQADANRRHWISTELGIALHRKHLSVHYQPIVDMSTMRMCGAEALLRWRHPKEGLIGPDVFIPVAEQNGTIAPISQWVFETCINDLERWQDDSSLTLSLAINLSVAQFVGKNHIEALLSLLNKSSLAHSRRITVEITESLKLSDRPEYIEVLNQFRACGCKIAIDDFGTGYSSLSYLKRIPVDIIKIDRSFVRDITTDPTDAATVRAILQIAEAFGLETVAEGVETEAQLAFLKEHGCKYAQGYLFSQAVPFVDLMAYARKDATT